MTGYKGKRKRGLTLTLYKKPFLYRLPVSPPRKRTKTTPNLKSPSIRTPSLLRKSLSISKYLYPFKRTSTPIRRNLFTRNDGNFTTDLQNASFMSLDQSIGKIEVDPKEEASVVEVFQDVLDKLSDVGKKDKLLKFFKLVQDGKFPLNNIAFELFLDIVEWFDKDESRQMRYSPSTLQFFWLGRKLFGGRFIRFMSGPKNESDILTGSSTSLSPLNSRVNFACPNENILRGINPLGSGFPSRFSPGLIDSMIELKAQHSSPQTSYVLMFDGKKVRKGGDVDLLGFEEGQTLEDKKKIHANEIAEISKLLELIKHVNRIDSLVKNTQLHERQNVYDLLKKCFEIVSRNIKELREFKKRKEGMLRRLKDLASKHVTKSSSFVYAIDLCRIVIYKVDNCLSTFLEVQWIICKTGSILNNVEHLFAKGNIIDLKWQENVRLLKSPEEMRDYLNVTVVPPALTKQRSQEWIDARRNVKVTGSTIYTAIGCDSLKKQKQHFDKVFSGVEADEPSEAQHDAMLHGTQSEVHEIATLSSIVMPFLFPDMIFHEEGYYVHNGMVVSPDGSLRSSGGVEFAFEGKAPVGNIFTTPVHYKIPSRYITQTVFERKVLSAKCGTLYLSWSTESTTVFIVPEDDVFCSEVEDVIGSLYDVRVPKRPTAISKATKTVTENIKNYVDKCIFLGEFPSVKGSDAEVNHQTTANDKTSLMYDEVIRTMMKAKKTLVDSYELRRNYASQVVVFLLADLNRMWKPEEPHAVPILYFFRGYSLSMGIARQIMDYCKQKCLDKGLDVVVSSSDGEFLPLMVRSKRGTPLTLHQLNKAVWTEVCKLQKTEIVQIFGKLNTTCMFLKVGHCIAAISERSDEAKIATPVNGWKTTKANTDSENVSQACSDENTDEVGSQNASDDDDDNVMIHEEVIGRTLNMQIGTKVANEEHREREVAVGDLDTSVLFEKENDLTVQGVDEIDITDEDSTILYDPESYNYDNEKKFPSVDDPMDHSSTQKDKYVLTFTDYSDILYLLRLQNDKKWYTMAEQGLKALLYSTDKLNKLLKCELMEITNFLDVKLKGRNIQLEMGTKMTKVDLVNQLSDYIGDGNHLEKWTRQKPKKSPKTLHELAANALTKKSYPKQVLNIAYATYIWPKRLKEWREKSHVAPKVIVKGDSDRTFEPYYVPEFDEMRQDFEIFVYDKTHLATNLRKCVCVDKVESISIRAWEKVAKQSPDILNRSVIEVSSEGKILDQMKEKLSRTMFSKKVEDVMVLNGDLKEANFCSVIREALFVADDKPGISAISRCQKRMDLIDWLADGVEFGHFPPYGARIKGLSHILYEGLRTSMEGKLYLYAIAKGGTYCARAPSTLCSESFFSTMQEMDPWGQGILTTSGVEKHISDFTTITAMKMQEDRDHFFDSNERARLTKEEECLYHPQPLNKPARGEQPIRIQYGYRINEAKLLPSQRMGLDLPNDV